MTLSKLFPWRRLPQSVVVADLRESVRRYASLLVQANALVGSLRSESATLFGINQHLAAENALLREHLGITSDGNQPSAAQVRESALRAGNSLATENAALIEKIDSLELELSMTRNSAQHLATENATLQDQRKRAMADQWMLKQINTALERDVSDLRGAPGTAAPSSTEKAQRNGKWAEPAAGKASADRTSVGDGRR